MDVAQYSIEPGSSDSDSDSEKSDLDEKLDEAKDDSPIKIDGSHNYLSLFRRTHHLDRKNKRDAKKETFGRSRKKDADLADKQDELIEKIQANLTFELDRDDITLHEPFLRRDFILTRDRKMRFNPKIENDLVMLQNKAVEDEETMAKNYFISLYGPHFKSQKFLSKVNFVKVWRAALSRDFRIITERYTDPEKVSKISREKYTLVTGHQIFILNGEIRLLSNRDRHIFVDMQVQIDGYNNFINEPHTATCGQYLTSKLLGLRDRFPSIFDRLSFQEMLRILESEEYGSILRYGFPDKFQSYFYLFK